MVGRSGRVLVMLAFVAVATARDDASARTIRRSCRDGVIAPRTAFPAQPPLPCDADAQCDGACSFAVPVCEASTCEIRMLTVPVRNTLRTRVVVDPGAAPTKLVLRCRPRTASCVVVVTTTTTSGVSTSGPSTTSPTSPGPTTTTRVRPIRPASTSSTTSTSTSSSISSSTTTSTLPLPCRFDEDCDGLASACAVALCSSENACMVTCVCRTPDFERTCAPDEAAACLTPADCPGLDADTCRVCYLNLCVTAPAPDCFEIVARP